MPDIPHDQSKEKDEPKPSDDSAGETSEDAPEEPAQSEQPASEEEYQLDPELLAQIEQRDLPQASAWVTVFLLAAFVGVLFVAYRTLMPEAPPPAPTAQPERELQPRWKTGPEAVRTFERAWQESKPLSAEELIAFGEDYWKAVDEHPEESDAETIESMNPATREIAQRHLGTNQQMGISIPSGAFFGGSY
ncbi:MAG: hypothetical protein KDD44_01230, partial [Bdellovibrionales bacterium]|nr:hypothetical protein [Bdellovibrionales bacterium]